MAGIWPSLNIARLKRYVTHSSAIELSIFLLESQAQFFWDFQTRRKMLISLSPSRPKMVEQLPRHFESLALRSHRTKSLTSSGEKTLFSCAKVRLTLIWFSLP